MSSHVEYRAAKTAPFGDDRAATYGRELTRLKSGVDLLSPQVIVDSARSLESPLHDFFLWDDSRAAEEHRKHQARQLTHYVVQVEVRDGGAESAPQRLLVNVQSVSDEGVSQGYVTMGEVSQRHDYQEYLERHALSQLRHWRSRYDEVKALQPIHDAIDMFDEKRRLVQRGPTPKEKR